MNSIKIKTLLLIFIVATIFGCKKDVLPKPSGQLRLDYKIAHYSKFNKNCPFSFDLNEQAIVKDKDNAISKSITQT